jgi:hypothetical protein
MTLGQSATAAGAPRRWVQNAFQALGLRPVYTENLARQLAFARAVKEACGMPLRQAFPLAEEALARWPEERVWRLAAPDGTVRVEVDLARWLSTYAGRLSLARCWYGERRRGRPSKRRRRGMAWAKWYGVDVTLLEESLALAPEERLRRLEEAAAFFRGAKVRG